MIGALGRRNGDTARSSVLTAISPRYERWMCVGWANARNFRLENRLARSQGRDAVQPGGLGKSLVVGDQAVQVITELERDGEM